MAKFERPKGGGSGGGGEGSGGLPPGPGKIGKIVEPRCKVCGHKERDRIDYLLAMRTPFAEIARLFPGVPEKSASNHSKEHLGYEDESIKRLIEYEAGIAQENLDAGLQGAFMRRTVLDVSIKKVLDGITAGTIPLEAKDVVKMIELRERIDANSASAQIEQYELQFNAFKSAMEEICPPDMLFKILERTKDLLKVGDKPALQAGD